MKKIITHHHRLRLLKRLVKHRLVSKVRAQAILNAYNYTETFSKDWEQISLEEFKKTSSPWKYLDPNKMIRANYYQRWLTDNDYENFNKGKQNRYVWSPYLGVYILNSRTTYIAPDNGMLFEYTDSHQELEYWFEYKQFFFVQYNLVTNSLNLTTDDEDDEESDEDELFFGVSLAALALALAVKSCNLLDAVFVYSACANSFLA